MTMQVYFVRHALADWAGWEPEHDDERPLNERGRRRFRASVVRLAALGLAPAAILTSPLVRARETAAILAEGVAGPVPIIEPLLQPGFDFVALTSILLRWSDAPQLVLVGHEPDLSQTVSDLIRGGRIVMKKGSVARVDLLHLAPPCGELIWLLAPKVLTKG
jgi:phosphohistidine phosphatase